MSELMAPEALYQEIIKARASGKLIELDDPVRVSLLLTALDNVEAHGELTFDYVILRSALRALAAREVA